MPRMGSAREPALAPVFRTAELRGIEARFADLGLMGRAGAAAANVAVDMLKNRPGPVVVLAGPGNNGGDGFVLARLLRAGFHDVSVVFDAEAARLPRDAAAAHAEFVAAGGSIVAAPPPVRPALVVDALFGLGFSRPLPGPVQDLVRWANAEPAPTLSLDIPTGLRADTGIATAPAIRADATATFLALKPGLLTAEGPDLAGSVSVHSLGVDLHSAVAAQGHMLEWPALAAALPEAFLRRLRASHKGTFGTLGIVGGAAGMTGAALLAGRAALRTGAGKVRIGFVADAAPSYDPAVPELMLGNARALLGTHADAWVVGCGLGTSDAARDALARAIGADVPLILDADALNILGEDPALRRMVRSRDAATIATPHPAEAARLLGSSVADVQHDRIEAAFAIARELRCHVALKGVGTVIAHPDQHWDINATGNPALSFAGSGDVLAGIIGACIVQHRDAALATRLAVCLHGAAADTLVARGIGPIGVSATELIDAARSLLNDAGRAAF
jgi:hydroxyethylthiazole kinase-like uncharacterized protein yjeF